MREKSGQDSSILVLIITLSIPLLQTVQGDFTPCKTLGLELRLPPQVIPSTSLPRIAQTYIPSTASVPHGFESKSDKCVPAFWAFPDKGRCHKMYRPIYLKT